MKRRADRIERHSRHLLLPGFTGAMQEALRTARVLVAGAGGLGSPAILYLAAAGVGTLGIVDSDAVELSNLQRQIAHTTADLRRAKAESAAEKARAIDPEVTVVVHHERLELSNVEALVGAYDIILDGTDNFPTRYLVGDAAHFARKPLCHGAVFRFEGQATTYDPRRADAPCHRCLFPEPPPPGTVPSCAEAGILGPTVGLIGVTQAAEAIKLITGLGEPLIGRLLLLDALRMEWRTIRYKKSPSCPLCGPSPSIDSLAVTAAGTCAR